MKKTYTIIYDIDGVETRLPPLYRRRVTLTLAKQLCKSFPSIQNMRIDFRYDETCTSHTQIRNEGRYVASIFVKGQGEQLSLGDQ